MKYFIILTIIFVISKNIMAAEGIALGPMRLYPEVDIGLKYNDNISWRSSNEQSSFVSVLSPKVKLERQERAKSYELSLGTEIGYFWDSHNDNYVDLGLRANTDWQLNRKSNVVVSGSYNKGHDNRGWTDKSDTGRPNTWNLITLKGKYNYGGRQSTARIETELQHSIKRYEDYHFFEKLDDNDNTNISSRFLYRLFARTYTFVEASYTMTKFQSQIFPRDNKSLNLSVGARWLITDQIEGKAQAGYLIKDFDLEGIENFSGLSWNAKVEWQTTKRVRLDMATSRATLDAFFGDFVIANNYSITARYTLNPRMSTSIGFSITDYEYPTSDRRSVETSFKFTGYNLGFHYTLWKDTTLSGGYNFFGRDSSFDNDNFNQNIFNITFTTAF